MKTVISDWVASLTSMLGKIDATRSRTKLLFVIIRECNHNVKMYDLQFRLSQNDSR